MWTPANVCPRFVLARVSDPRLQSMDAATPRSIPPDLPRTIRASRAYAFRVGYPMAVPSLGAAENFPGSRKTGALSRLRMTVFFGVTSFFTRPSRLGQQLRHAAHCRIG